MKTEGKLHHNICKNFQLQLEKFNLNHKRPSSAVNLEPTVFTLEPIWAKQDPIPPVSVQHFGNPGQSRVAICAVKPGCIRQGPS